jgi:hypothetical protein
MTPLKKIFCIFLLTLLLQSCKKQLQDSNSIDQNVLQDLKIPDNFFIKDAIVPGVATGIVPGQTVFQSKDALSLPDNGDSAIILGAKLNNPYTIANMQKAYHLLYGINTQILPNNLYIRFKPASVAQLEILEDNEDLELQDYPMDYEVIKDGDYYQDPNLGTEDIPWLYSVVPVTYKAPAGIQHEVVAPIHIPNNNPLLEDMAESVAAGVNYEAKIIDGQKVIVRADIKNKEGGPVYLYPPEPPCDDSCGGGGGNPPPPANDPKIPRGVIKVQDIPGCNLQNTNVPLRQARVICKRWFKIDKMYTNDQGQFVSTKKFKNKVKVTVKTKNGNAKISKIRGIRFWQMLFPVKKRIGVFSQGAMANIAFTFSKPGNTNAHDPELPYWVAATTHNSVVEFRQYATEFGIGQPPAKLKVMVSNWGEGFRATGAAPMFNKCNGDLATLYAAFFLISPLRTPVVGGMAILISVLKNQVDIMIGYQPRGGDYSCNNFNSSWLKSLTYHELGHAQHFAQAGCDFWKQYRNAIVNEMSKFNQADYSPYGTGNDANNAPVIATGEMWGNHCQYIFTNRHYGNKSGLFTVLQNQVWVDVQGLKCYLNAIENFNPNKVSDIWRWIPQGLLYDLFDNINDNQNPIVDNVSGYTIKQSFNALQPDVRSIPLFKSKLLQQNANSQFSQINALFNQYGY